MLTDLPLPWQVLNFWLGVSVMCAALLWDMASEALKNHNLEKEQDR